MSRLLSLAAVLLAAGCTTSPPATQDPPRAPYTMPVRPAPAEPSAPAKRPEAATQPEPARTSAPRRVGAGSEYDGVVLAREAQDAAPAILPATLRIDPAAAVRPLSTDLLGVTLGGRETENVLFGAGDALADDARAMLPRLPLHLVRIAQYNNPHGREVGWKQAVGPVAQRPVVRFTPWDKPAPNRCGPAEIVAAIRAADAQARFVWTVDIENPDPDDAADLAEYLTGTTGNPRGGTDWAAVRRSDGLADPVPVVLWELGNETDWRKPEERLSADAYVERCRRAIAAIRSVAPDARFAPHAATAPWAWQDRFKEDWRTWHRAILAGLAADIDHLVFHPYYFGYPTAVIDRYMDQIREDIRATTGGSRIGLYISEHGLWPNAAEGQPWETSWWKTHGLPGCLATAQFLNRVAARDDIGPVTYHSLSCGPWGAVYRTRDGGRLWSTGIADLFRLYRDHLGTLVLRSGLDGAQCDPAAEDCSLTALASRRDGTVAVLLANRSPSQRRVEVVLASGAWRIASAQRLSGDGPEARNTPDHAAIRIDPVTVADLSRVDLPARTVTGLILAPR